MIYKTTMERFLYMKILCSCIIHFSNCYKASITAKDPAEDSKVYLNISDAYIDVKVDETIYIKCSGSPPLKWDYPSGLAKSFSKEVFGSKNESIIRLKFDVQEATGRYICKNDHSKASVYIFVNGDKLILNEPHEILYKGNEYIHCIPTTSKANMTLWKLNSTGTHSTRVQVPLAFDRTRGFLAKPDPHYFTGTFECEAEFGGKSEIAEVILEVLPETTSAPNVTIDSSNATYVMVGSSFNLTCIVRTDYYAHINITWIYSNKDTTRKKETEYYNDEDNEKYLYMNRTLSILKATESDTGSYLCKALDHSLKEETAQVDVTVYATPPATVLTFFGETKDAVANKHGKLDLIAKYKVFPPTSIVQTKWSKDDEPLISKYKHNARQTSSFVSLEISDLNGNDSGLYTVTANASGFIANKSFLLLVKDKPIVDMSLNPSCCFYPEQKYNLTCEIKGYPQPNISWSWKPFCFNDSHCNSSDVTSKWNTFEKYYEVNNSTVKTITEGIRSITYLSVVGEESGFYKCKAENEMGETEAEKQFVVSDALNGFEITYATDNSIEVAKPATICKASFVVYSHLEWKRIYLWTNESGTVPAVEQDFSTTLFSLATELKESTASTNEKYVCAATKRDTGEVEEKSLPFEGPLAAPTQSHEMSPFLLLILVLLGIFLTLITAVSIIMIRMKRKKKKIALQDLSHPFAEGKLELFNSNLPLDEQVDLLPYDESWEFPREKLKFGRTLGQGAFGRVVKAEAFEINEDGIATTVAVKMLKERGDRNQQKSLMAELKILIHLGHHVNIVNLMGAVTKNIRKDGIMVIVEYCRYGNIRHYLQRNRDRFMNEIDTQSGKIFSTGDMYLTENEISHDSTSELLRTSSSSSSGVFSVHNPNYRQIRVKSSVCTDPRGSDCSHMPYFGSFSTSSGSYSRSDSQDTVVTTSDLLCFAFQCSRGMEYLASRKLIHRDLAARNVLLAEGKIVKICDFGLAKDCYKYSNYVKKGDGPLPIKWMSIESIWDHVFTTQSDVWSFGILMWELFTLGGNPYPGLDIDEHFYKKLKSGYRMEKPELCPAFLYDIMKECWNANPDKRPHFALISERLGNSLDESIKQHYIDVNEPYMEMNRKLKSPFYSNVERLEQEESMRPYVNSNVQDTAPEYDIPRACSIFDESIPSEPMEIVPMIQLESTCQRHLVVPCNEDTTTELHDKEKLNTQENSQDEVKK